MIQGVSVKQSQRFRMTYYVLRHGESREEEREKDEE